MSVQSADEIRSMLVRQGAAVGLYLNIEAPDGVLTPEVKALVMQMKPALMAMLAFEGIDPACSPLWLTKPELDAWKLIHIKLRHALPSAKTI
jgi:hypothetical protein